MSNKRDTPLAGLLNETACPADANGQRVFQCGRPSHVELTEVPFPAIVNLRGNSAEPAFVVRAGKALGSPLPVAPNTVAENEHIVCYWLSPDEWLIRTQKPTPENETYPPGVQVALEKTLASEHVFATTDQSSAYSVLQLHGPHAIDVLAKGTPLDLHPSVLPKGKCAQTHWFRASVLLRPLGNNGDAWEIIVRRSFADSTARMLMDAMQEYL
ncbi:MAG: sarcosine oxidase subunit gamma family protein [Lautropia sp.]|nr:sarcosine oxidase subunit gamma family protein [Lautropia sp.]